MFGIIVGFLCCVQKGKNTFNKHRQVPSQHHIFIASSQVSQKTHQYPCLYNEGTEAYIG